MHRLSMLQYCIGVKPTVHCSAHIQQAHLEKRTNQSCQKSRPLCSVDLGDSASQRKEAAPPQQNSIATFLDQQFHRKRVTGEQETLPLSSITRQDTLVSRARRAYAHNRHTAITHTHSTVSCECALNTRTTRRKEEPSGGKCKPSRQGT